jgi:hypothetical protein
VSIRTGTDVIALPLLLFLLAATQSRRSLPRAAFKTNRRPSIWRTLDAMAGTETTAFCSQERESQTNYALAIIYNPRGRIGRGDLCCLDLSGKKWRGVGQSAGG